MSKRITDYGKAYYDFITNKACHSQNWNSLVLNMSIPVTSQKVYSLIPNSDQYINDHAICNTLSITIAYMFLTSSSFIEYAESFAAVSQKLAKEDAKVINSIRTQKLDRLKEYSLASKFVHPTKLHTEFINHAFSLQDEGKSSILMVIGDHVVDIMLSKNGQYITFGYYDAYEGQLYKQSVTESDLQNTLSSNDKFAHPFSILNDNNILLGRVSIRDEVLINMNIDLVLLTYVTTEKNKEQIKSSIALDKNIKPETVIKFLAENPSVIKQMSAIVEYNAFNNFLKDYKEELLTSLSIAKDCIAKIMNCSNKYLLEIFTVVDSAYRLNVLYSHTSTKTSGPLLLPKTKGKLCIKEVSPCYEIVQTDNAYVRITYPDKPTKQVLLKSIITAEQNYFKILYEDKAKMEISLKKCVSEKHELTQKQIADNICQKFINANNKNFFQANSDFYDYTDVRRAGIFQEKCIDQDSFFSNNNDVVKQIHEEL